MWNNNFTRLLQGLAREILHVYWVLVKVMLPAVIVVKILEEIGATNWLATLLSPMMQFVGLPEELGLVWAVAILTNIYTAMVVFYSVAATTQVTVADISILGSMILIAHALPVEGAIAKTLGISWRNTLLVRLGGAIVYGFVLNLFYSGSEYSNTPLELAWVPQVLSDQGLLQWCMDQLKLFASILVIISALIILLKLLRWLKIEALLHKVLTPLLRGLTLGKEAANITIIGMTLGISFGAGLLIDEVKKGHIDKRDTVLVMGFLGICHSIIEDTLLILLLGADINAILWGRIVFAIAVIAVWGRVVSSARVATSR